METIKEFLVSDIYLDSIKDLFNRHPIISSKDSEIDSLRNSLVHTSMLSY